jgi:hypothetical protein
VRVTGFFGSLPVLLAVSGCIDAVHERRPPGSEVPPRGAGAGSAPARGEA